MSTELDNLMPHLKVLFWQIFEDLVPGLMDFCELTATAVQS